MAREPRNHPASAASSEVARLSWGSQSSSDPLVIARWASEYPGCAWGVPMGIENGLVAIDIDSEQASAWWDARWLPDGLEAQTPSGGRHIYYSLNGERGVDIQTNKSKVFDGIDIRGEGGYVVAYLEDYSSAPELPESVAEILPERQTYSLEEIPEVDSVDEASPQEQRVIKGFLDKLDALPRPWRRGAGYHDTQFFVACSLQRAARSPFLAITMDEARSLFLKHAPVREKKYAGLPEQRWNSALKATAGQWFREEDIGDVPVRLEATDALDSVIQRSASSRSALERGFYDSSRVGDVKTLIRELRMAGATEQEAYSISYSCKAMLEMRKKGADRSTWGWVKAEYEKPAGADMDTADPSPAPSSHNDTENGSLLTPAERDVIRNFPNFIDDYIDVAKEMFAEPNLPLHYVNAWVALSCILGDQGWIQTREGRRPLNIWSIHAAPSASGKRGSMEVLEQVVGAARGWGSVYLGEDASAEEMADILLDRGMSTGIFMQDEAARLLEGMHGNGQSYERKFVTAALKWYDGKVSRNVRRGMDRAEVGATSNTVFNMWLQTTWANISKHMTQEDVSTGFVGRFIFAIGGKAKITRESLTPHFLGEYEITETGSHPAASELGRRVGAHIHHKIKIEAPDSEVIARYVDAREDVRKVVAARSVSDDAIDGIVLRLSEQTLKGAYLLALSEGRGAPVMTDMLLAIKSLGYWLRDLLLVIDEINSSDYRRRIDQIVKFIAAKPRTRAEILSKSPLANLQRFEVDEILTRAEQEGSIVLSDSSKRWELRE